MRLIYDLETDGLLDTVTKVHCLVTRDYDTNEVKSYYDDTSIKHPTYAGPLMAGVLVVLSAQYRLGHNIITYDEPVLRKFFPNLMPEKMQYEKARDTVIGARVAWPEEHLKSLDYMRKLKPGNDLPGKLFGSHKLEAWGYRLKILKGDYGKTDGFATFTLAMLEYCIQDTNVTRVLCQKLVQKKLVPSQAWIWEQKFADRLEMQMKRGFPFDVQGANELVKTLTIRRAQLSDDLQRIFPPETKTVEHITKKLKVKKLKQVTVVFNPNSRVQIIRLMKERYAWKPTEFTKKGEDAGRPKLDETTLDSLKGNAGVPEIIEFLTISKRVGQIATGKQAWLKVVKEDGRIHGTILHNAAVTNRCTHRNPNMTQAPVATKKKDGSPVAPYGAECRRLFRADPSGGWKLVGFDASGLELRMLANRLAPYDNGAYISVVTTGDVHTKNMIAAGLSSRDQAKTFIYAFLYGAGDAKLGKTMGKSKAAGRAARARLLTNMPALRKWIEDTKRQASIKRRLQTLDGRYLHVRAAHASPNTQLQGDGAIVMKYATVLYSERLESMGLREGEHWYQVHMAHDEIQVMAREEHAKTVGEVGVWAIAEAGIILKVRCPLTGEYKIGNNWAETH